MDSYYLQNYKGIHRSGADGRDNRGDNGIRLWCDHNDRRSRLFCLDGRTQRQGEEKAGEEREELFS